MSQYSRQNFIVGTLHVTRKLRKSRNATNGLNRTDFNNFLAKNNKTISIRAVKFVFL